MKEQGERRGKDAGNTIISRIRTVGVMAENSERAPISVLFLITCPGQGHNCSSKTINIFPPFEWTNITYFRKDFLKCRMENVQFPYSPILILQLNEGNSSQSFMNIHIQFFFYSNYMKINLFYKVNVSLLL